jgi:thiol-disulfide isomerase/thioredoxin
VAAVAVASAAAGLAFHLGWRERTVAESDQHHPKAVVEQIYSTRLADLKANLQPLEQWRGRVMVVNFWATWCAPCREEIPGFVRLQARHGARGLTFVGIAIDQPGNVADFAREFGINYPVLIGGPEALDLLRRAGNRAGVLPFTLVIDREGNLVSRQPGGVKEDALEGIIQPLL